jgi:hypothetical protein
MSTQDSIAGDENSPFQRGHVVWVEWEDHIESRPFLILNSHSHPQQDEEYTGVPLSTAEQKDAIQIQPADWTIGGLNEPCFAISWRLQTIPHRTIERGIGALSDKIVEEVARSARSFFDPEDEESK